MVFLDLSRLFLKLTFKNGNRTTSAENKKIINYIGRKWNSSFPQLDMKENQNSTVSPNLEHISTVTEVRIPTIGGFVAGKLWQGQEAVNGKSDIPIICMHGWLDNAGTFDTLLPLIMKPRTTALAIDFPGHGLSSHVAAIHYDSQIEGLISIHSVLRHFGWEKFIILGHSLGAIVGFVFAGIFSEKVHSFIALENVRPIPRNCKDEIRYAVLKLLEVDMKLANLANKNQLQIPAYQYEEILKKFYEGRGESINLDGCKILLKRGAISLPNNQFRFAHDIRAAIPTGLWRFASSQTEEIAVNIKCPVCFIKGEPGGDYEARTNYMHIVELMKTSSPKVEFHRISGTHHFHLNDPHQVAPIISQFLESKS